MKPFATHPQDAVSSRRSHLFAALLCLAFAILAVPTRVAAQENAEAPAPQVDATRSVLDKWFEARTLIAKRKREWSEGRQILDDRIELEQQQIASLRDKTTKDQEKLDSAGSNLGEYEAKKAKLAAESAVFEQRVEKLETRTLALIEKLPPLFQDKVKLLSQRIPRPKVEGDEAKDGKPAEKDGKPAEKDGKPAEEAGAAAREQKIGERYQNVVGILNQLNKLNSVVTVASEVRDLPGGSVEVTSMYLGLGQAYYANAKGTVAGLGTLSDTGWVWKPANEKSKEIAKAIQIRQGQKGAEFVSLPVEIR